MFSKSTFALASSFALVNGAVHTVMVGKGGLNYSPNSLTAAVGDSVEFQFESQGHSVAQGSFDKACSPSGSSAFYSGFVKPGGEPFTITIENTDPIWFYCTQISHCQSGMVGVINPPSGKTVDDYSTAAGNSDGTTAPNAVGGGVFGVPSSSMSSSMMTSSSMAPESSSMMSTTMSTMPSSSMMTSTTMSTSMMGMSTMTSAMSTASTTASTTASAAASTVASTTSTSTTNAAGHMVAGLGAILAGAAAFAL